MGGCFSDIRSGNKNAERLRGCFLLSTPASTNRRLFPKTGIMDLPEEIISIIMSKLSLKDVVNCSAVSKQWLHFPTGLDSFLIDTQMVKKGLTPGAYQFLRRDTTLRHKSALPVCFDILFSFTVKNLYAISIDGWVIEAIYNGATSLIVRPVLPFHAFCLAHGITNTKYVFPWTGLHYFSARLESLTLRACIFGGFSICTMWTSLRTLDLGDTIVENRELEMALKHFPNLRKLVLYHCNSLSKIRIRSPTLTSLTVWWCTGLEEIDLLDNSALTEFDYRGFCIGLARIRSPKLIELRFAFSDVNGDDYIFQNLCGDIATKLSIHRGIELTQSHQNGRMNIFPHLTELKLRNHPARGTSCQTLNKILKVCPALRRLEMVPSCVTDAENVIESPVQYRHKCLKYIKISGFCGSMNKVNVVKFLIQVTEELHHVVVERKIEDEEYKDMEEQWHGEQEPEVVKDMFLKVIRSEQLTFSCV